MAGEKFHYEPLELTENPFTQDAFRLLEIHPRNPGDFVQGKLVRTAISRENETYFAVSYTWGEEEAKEWIVLNNNRFYVRENLLLFLKSYTKTLQTRTFIWIDAICIDQENIPERNQQVQVMRTIYSRSRRVIAWLGPASADSDDLFDYANTRHPCADTLTRNSPDADDPRVRDSLDSLLQRGYWTRMWIIQEIIVAKEILLMCGDRSVEWEDLVPLVNGHHSEYRMAFLALQEARESREFEEEESRTYGGVSQVFKLYDAIEAFGDRQCHDKRDRIYALLGVASDYRPTESQNVFTVDYSVSLEQLFRDVLEFCGAQVPPSFIYRLLCVLNLWDIRRNKVPEHIINSGVFDSHIKLELKSTGTLDTIWPHAKSEQAFEGIFEPPLPPVFWVRNSPDRVWNRESFGVFIAGDVHYGDPIFDYFYVTEGIATGESPSSTPGTLSRDRRDSIATIPILLRAGSLNSNEIPNLHAGISLSTSSDISAEVMKRSEQYRQRLAWQLESAVYRLTQDGEILQLSLPLKHWISWFYPGTWIAR